MLSEKMQLQLEKGSPIREAFEEGKRLEKIYGPENVFDYSIGNPEIPAPECVREAIEYLAKEDPLSIHGYMHNAGYEDVRKTIAASLNRRFQTSFCEKNIVMSNGAAGAMNLLMCAIMDPGDEVIVMKPYYPGYGGFIKNWNGHIVTVEPDPFSFQPDLADLGHKITERTKLVIVNSPNNPTGVIYTEETVKGIAEILERKQQEYGHGICLLSDEPYRELVYSGNEVPFWTKYYANTAVAYSFSKTLSIPGERIGYLVIPDEMQESERVIRAVRAAAGILGYVNAPAMFQKVAGMCIDETADIAAYRKNRDLLYDSLVELGFDAVSPEGAFYIFVKAPDGDERRLLEAAHECNILLVGGSAFGYSGYARISFCVSYDKIKRSLPAFGKLAELIHLRR